MAIESFVSISSPSMFEIRVTISSTSHSSYLRGNTLGGHSLGFDLLGVLGWLDATTDDDGLGLIGSCDLRLLLGDSV